LKSVDSIQKVKIAQVRRWVRLLIRYSDKFTIRLTTPL